MREVLAINDLGRGAGGIENDSQAPVTAVMRAQSRDVSGELKALGREAIRSLQGREGGGVVLPQGVHQPGNRGELAGIRLAVAHQRLGHIRIRANARQAGQHGGRSGIHIDAAVNESVGSNRDGIRDATELVRGHAAATEKLQWAGKCNDERRPWTLASAATWWRSADQPEPREDLRGTGGAEGPLQKR